MITVLLEALNGGWVAIAGEPLVAAEQTNVGGNTWGFDTCSFTLRRDPTLIYPELGAWTPCEIWEDGTLIFEGRVQETPTRKDPDDESISVTGRGWQYHGDDDASIEYSWVHTRLGDWADSRQHPDCTLGAAGHFAAPQIGTDGGITITYPDGTAHPAGGRAGITLDFKSTELGPLRVLIDATTSNNDAGLGWYVKNSESPDPFNSTDQETIVAGTVLAASHAFAGTFTTRMRYLHIFLHRAAAVTYAADVWVKIARIACFRDPDLEAARQSVAKSSRFIADSLPFAPLLDQDTDGIEDTTFGWPDFHLPEPRTFRELVDAANAAHRWQPKVAAGRRMTYRPQRTLPKYRASSRIFENPSANSGEEMYNLVNVSGTGPDGQPLRVRRHAAQLEGAPLEPVTAQTFPNPSFDVNAASWAVTGGASIARIITTVHTAPGAGLFTPAGAGGAVSTTLGGTWERGVAYVVRGRFRLSDVAAGENAQMKLTLGKGRDAWTADVTIPGGPVWTLADVVWVPKIDQTTPTFRVHSVSGGYNVVLDTLEVFVSKPTLVDRRGFVRSKRLEVPAPLVVDAGNRFGDAFLETHQRTPMRGSATLAPGDVFGYLDGRPVHPRELVIEGGELLHISDLTDPDTGAAGRDVMLSSIGYDPDTELGTVQLDNTRDNQEALIARYAVVAGGGGGG